ncbi:MAG: ribosomal protein S18-alanine N-acetyltransferase [Anaerolineales bacterium]
MPITTEIVIRPMKVDDIPQVVAVDQASFALPWTERSYRFEIQQNKASICLVAEESLPDGSQRIVGMLVAWLLVDELHIATIGVLPEARRCGIGRQLLAHAFRLGKARGATTSTLEVRVSNLPAQALYHQFGYTTVGRRRKYYKDNNEDALLMLAPLLSIPGNTPQG